MHRIVVGISIALMTGAVGCSIELDDFLDDLEVLEITIGDSVGTIQTDDPRSTPLPSGLIGQQETIIIHEDVIIITDISEDLVIETLPDMTLLGFQNFTGWDIFLEYAVDGEIQAVLVYDGETLLLEYPCLFLIELLEEQDFDPFTGEFVGSFDLSGSFFENPFDFECGDALILTIDEVSVVAQPERINLVF